MKQRIKERIEGVMRVTFTLIIGFFFLSIPAHSNVRENIDLRALIKETQKMAQEPDKMTLAWWIPEQFWQASLEQNPNITKEQTDQILKTIRPYIMITVVDGQVGAFGGVTYKSAETVRNSVKLKDTQGRSYAPLNESEIDADTKNMLQMLKPVMVNMLGQMGENMHFILFQRKDKDGKPIADATKKGSFKVIVGSKEFEYRLPLGSVLPPKYDPETGEKFPGNYNYNPFTGRKLVMGKPNKTVDSDKR